MSDVYVREGDNLIIRETLRDASLDPVDIALATIHLTVTPIRGGTRIVDADIDNLQNGDGSDGSKGNVGYDGTSADTATPGDYLGSIQATYVDGTKETFPNDGYILITVTPAAPTTEGRYLTREELKNTLELTGQSFADADIDVAIEAASRGLEDAWGARWTLGADGEARYYTAYERDVELGDVLKITSVDLDYGSPWGFVGGGTYSTPLTTADYRLLPITSGLVADGGDGTPFKTLQLTRGSSVRCLPRGVDAVKITGQFGWETVPAGVRQATSIIATRLFKRTREAPFGIHALGLEGAAVRAVQIARDPEVTFIMGAVSGARSLIV